MKAAICLFVMLLISSVPALAQQKGGGESRGGGGGARGGGGESHGNGGNTHSGGGHIPARGPAPAAHSSAPARTSAPVHEAPANRDNRGGQPSDARRSFRDQP